MKPLPIILADAVAYAPFSPLHAAPDLASRVNPMVGTDRSGDGRHFACAGLVELDWPEKEK